MHQIYTQFIFLRKSLLESSKLLQFVLYTAVFWNVFSLSSCWYPFVHLYIKSAFPVSVAPFLSWLSYLFEDILQELLEKGCVGGKFFEILHLKISWFYPCTWLIVWLGREIPSRRWLPCHMEMAALLRARLQCCSLEVQCCGGQNNVPTPETHRL